MQIYKKKGFKSHYKNAAKNGFYEKITNFYFNFFWLSALTSSVCTAAKKPFLTEAMKMKRLKWAKKFSRWTQKKWCSVLFLDESCFETKASSAGLRVRRRPGIDHRFEPKFTRQNFKKPEKLMMWGAISGDGKKRNSFLEKGEKMNSAKYTSILKKEVVDKEKSTQVTIIQDNASIHTSYLTKAFLKEHGVTSVYLPPNSPDIMPIENCFGRVKQKLETKDTRTKTKLKSEVTDVWKSQSLDYLHSLCSSMPRRLQEVIKQKGAMIGY